MAVQQRVFFKPSDTDPAITQFNSNHYSVVDPEVPGRGVLLLFIPGTGAIPSMYREFPQYAASRGFHALSVIYPNSQPINDLCFQFAPVNPDAAGDARLEVIDGVDRVSFLSVDTVNCIQARVLKALQYLHTSNPALGWGQFYSGDNVLWDRIMVSGHSQGGGMAAMLAKTRITARCILFASMDWWVAGNRPYNWMSLASQTPVDRWYLLAHQRDQFLDFGEMQASASALDVTRYGAFFQVDSSGSPTFGRRHFLSTNLEPAQSTSYHGCPVVDAALPRMPDGVTPVFQPVWDYLLFNQTQPLTIECEASAVRLVFSPGTLEQSENLSVWTQVSGVTSPLLLPSNPSQSRRFYRLAVP